MESRSWVGATAKLNISENNSLQLRARERDIHIQLAERIQTTTQLSDDHLGQIMILDFARPQSCDLGNVSDAVLCLRQNKLPIRFIMNDYRGRLRYKVDKNCGALWASGMNTNHRLESHIIGLPKSSETVADDLLAHFVVVRHQLIRDALLDKA